MHVTFNYGRLYKFPENIVGKEVEVIIVGYGSDGLNSGFAVEIPEELNKFYKNKSVAHITVSLGELNGIKGKAVDTGKLGFNKLDKRLKIKGGLDISYLELVLFLIILFLIKNIKNQVHYKWLDFFCFLCE